MKAMNAEFDEARALYRSARELLRDLGQGVHAASTGIDVAVVELLAGDLAAAEREIRPNYSFLEQRGETYFLSTLAALLARVIRDQGRDDEALALSQRAEATAAEHDLDAQVLWRSVQAPILARAQKFEDAERLGNEAVELARKSGLPIALADALFGLAVVQVLIDQRDRACATLDEAIALYEAKGDRVSRDRLSAWRAQTLGQ
jgi:tetratricopeptide (TPR) repeat protein